MTCTCQTVEAVPVIRLCQDHHCYWYGDQRRTSISGVMKRVWPVKPSWDSQDTPDSVKRKVENARERGQQVDEMFSQWVVGNLKVLPPTINGAGRRDDAVERLSALMDWWNSRPFGEVNYVATQKIVHDDELAGTIDLVLNCGEYILDLKNTSSIETTHSLKLGAYADLHQRMHGRKVRVIGDIHVTKKRDEPVKVKFREYELSIALNEWQKVREFWSLVRRKTKAAQNAEIDMEPELETAWRREA